MPTDQEIERRVTTDDTPITARRIAIAQKVSELGTQIAVVSEQLQRLIGQVRQEISGNHEIITVEKLSIYTDIPKATLNEWLAGQKTMGNKRKRSPVAESALEHAPSRSKPHQLMESSDRASEGTPTTAKDASAGISKHAAPRTSEEPDQGDHRRLQALPAK